MNSRKTALSFAAAGTAAGVVGLVLLATPAGAGEAPPALPPVSAESLVQSVLNTEIPAFAGSVEVQNHLGLPIPGIPASPSNGKAAEVWADGSGKARLAVPGRQSEMTIVDDGSTVWVWNSEDRTVTKVPHQENAGQKPLEGMFADPAKAAAQLVTAMQQDSTVTVDGTARVADRPVYQLVLTPKPTEKTLLREIRVSIDSELRIPMSVEVLANGQADPAVKIGFTDFTHATQDPKLFAFTPPAGASVSEEKVQDEVHGQNLEDWLGKVDMKTVGRGWDIVATGKIPAELMNTTGERSGQDLTALLGTFGKEVHGDFGTGYVISASVGTALITQDGQVAVGAVPQQVLVEALKTVK
ncbi:LolA family protein [Actinophytocola sp.]|uniref:LolA family protein n=1 Tax=Actinophytocola sp. TaxID=1872138 RepID=UPI002D3FB297|nr:outer-membrane lipoprotein carrier protein LolA [Actinophytocola sp.]HYQ61702.1 outer-membrane lipoprotein carrier protein LolA [Actinophytocola sp.]